MSTFNDRLNTALGGPFEPFMRRSIQTVILFEAHRCLKEKFPSMRPFQKKMAIFDQANYLLNGTSLLPHQREEVMWRTGTSKEVLNPDMMWRRTRVVVQDVHKLAKQMEAFAEANPPTPQGGDESGSKKEHEEVYRAFLQKQYEEMTGKTSETFPPRFEFTHNNCLLVYKMYFNKGTQLDTSFPPPENRELVLPAKKSECAAGPGTPLFCVQRVNNKHGVFARSPPGSPMHPGRMQQQKRLEQLREVREYMDLLKQFEGIVDEEAMNKRKRELFEALPPAPPACGRNNCKNQIAKNISCGG
ncbi:hypothetical protein IV203_004951 [Nitzschia inconspicua]|uniref:Uncharacterized protein n=1 Tax=Nitzschia inconspicua TaxID=303405 RepID=A0A9K3PI72_9STRA|nr:hypothetical protein IV203_004951 [Nitzschia inconspicua]